MIDSRSQPPTLYLAGQLEHYVNSDNVARPAESRSGVIISLTPDTPLDSVLGLVRQAFFLASSD